MSKKKVTHTFVDASTQEIYCANCGEREKIKLPIPLSAFPKFIDYFDEKHRHCKPPKQQPTPNNANERSTKRA